MSKETSTILKGIAILMMLFLHLFNHDDIETFCTPLIYIGDKPLISYLSNASNPVVFFMILSGYGLTYLYTHQRLTTRNQAIRLLKLFIHYWVVLLIFVSIGHFISPVKYPHSILHVLGNITGIYCSYNGEIWFLFPYAVVCMLSPVIIKYVYHLKNRLSILLTIVCYSIVFLSVRHLGYNLPGDILWDTLLIQPVYWVQLTFYFSLGIVLYRLLENKTQPLHSIPPTIYAIILCLVISIKCNFKITIADGFYALAFIWCFIHIPFHKYIHKVLHELGRYSMVMWMTHTFYSVYLFQNFIYGFKYPVLIYIVLLIVSYFTAIIISNMTKRIIQYIHI